MMMHATPINSPETLKTPNRSQSLHTSLPRRHCLPHLDLSYTQPELPQPIRFKAPTDLQPRPRSAP